jgi:hypothetical protein
MSGPHVAQSQSLSDKEKGARPMPRPFRKSFDSDDQFIVGMTNSAPSFIPLGQREVTVLVFV